MIKKIYVLISILFLLILSCTPKQDPTDNDMVKVKVNVITSYSSILPLNFYVAKEGSTDFKHIGTVTDKDTSDGNNYIYTFEVDPGIFTVKITGTSWGDFTGEKVWHNMRFDIGKEYTIDAYLDDQNNGEKSYLSIITSYKSILPLRLYLAKVNEEYQYIGMVSERNLSNNNKDYMYTFRINPGTYDVKITGTTWGNFSGEKIYKEMKFNVNNDYSIPVYVNDDSEMARLKITTSFADVLPLEIYASKNNGPYEYLGNITSSMTTDNKNYSKEFSLEPGNYSIKITGNKLGNFTGEYIYNNIRLNVGEVNEDIKFDTIVDAVEVGIGTFEYSILPLDVYLSKDSGNTYEKLGTVKTTDYISSTKAYVKMFYLGKATYDFKITGKNYRDFPGSLILKDETISENLQTINVYNRVDEDARKQTNTYVQFIFENQEIRKFPITIYYSKNNSDYEYLAEIVQGEFTGYPNRYFYFIPGNYSFKITWQSTYNNKEIKEKIWANEQLYANQTKVFRLDSNTIAKIEQGLQ